MRLQGAIFYLEDTLFDGETVLPDADKVLSILRMESVWMYGITKLPRAEAEALLEEAGLAKHFRGFLSEKETRCAVESEEMLEKAMRRLQSQKRDTVVFAATKAQLEAAKAGGYRAVAVQSSANDAPLGELAPLAEEALPSYTDWLRQDR